MQEKRPKIPAKIMRKVLVEAGHRCAIKTCRQFPVEIHHIEPWEKVKEHKFENLIALCPTCHTRSHNGDIDRLSLLTYKKNLTKDFLSEVTNKVLSENTNAKPSLLKLRDEIYVDHTRIKSYTQQVNLPKLLNYFPNWIHEAWFSVEGALDRFAILNEQNYHLKIAKLVQYMQKTNDISEGRPNRQGKGVPQFWLENCIATRAYFKIDGALDFSIWVSYEDEQEENKFLTQEEVQNFKAAGHDVGKPGKLFLLESLESQDAKYVKRFSSPYSFLYELGVILEPKLEKTSNQKILHEEGLSEQFAKEPLQALKSLGAKIYQRRKISVLYKIRNLFPEFYYFDRYQFTVIGYPLMILDNRADNNLKLHDIISSIDIVNPDE